MDPLAVAPRPVPELPPLPPGAAGGGDGDGGEDLVDSQQPTQTFSVDLAKGLVELLTHSRGVAGSLASARTEVNTGADKYEAILRELKANTAVVVNLGTENKGLTEMVIELKKVVEGGTPEARAQTEDEITQCRTAYDPTLVQLFAKAATTADVWKGQADTTAVAHSIVAKTLGLSLKEAEERVNGMRETTRVASIAANSRSVPRTSPIVKVFSNRRATFSLHLSDAIV